MRMIYRAMAVALLLTVVGAWASLPGALAQERAEGRTAGTIEDAFWRLPASADFPVRRVAKLGLGKSLLLEFPFELKDVVVSSPDKVDAVVQSSNRVFLIAKGQGETNAFFFNTKGQQVLLLDIRVGADLEALDAVLKRFVPGSNIRAEMAGRAAILAGTVRTPLDGKRAADIACQFVAANKSAGTPISSTSNSATSGTSQYSSTTLMTGMRSG